ncbi:hypothetical protein IWZ01DRAFT_544882 [Phyllosticta capitalensis]
MELLKTLPAVESLPFSAAAEQDDEVGDRSEFKGKTTANIRGYHEKDGKTLPTGVSLTVEQ